MNETTRKVLLAARPAVCWPGETSIRAGVTWVTFAFEGRQHRLLDLEGTRTSLGDLLAENCYAIGMEGILITRSNDDTYRVVIGDGAAALFEYQLAALYDWLCLVEGVEQPFARGYNNIVEVRGSRALTTLVIGSHKPALQATEAVALANAIFRCVAGCAEATIALAHYTVHIEAARDNGDDSLSLFIDGLEVTTAYLSRLDLLAIAANLMLAAESG